MASKHRHIERAQHNEGLLEPLVRLDTHPDWYITVSFYAAVHWLRAYLAANDIGSGERDDLHYDEFEIHLREISRRNSPGRQVSAEVERIIREFSDLKRLARDARYRCFAKHWYDQRVNEADAALRAIKTFVFANGITP